MASVPALVPAEHTSDHVLVVPRRPDDDGGAGHDRPRPDGPGHDRPGDRPGGDLPELAAAWFDDVAWLAEPSAAAPGRPAGGARFHGVRAAVRSAPGVLRLGAEHRATGPFPLDPAAAAALGTAAPADAWALGRGDGALDVRGARPAVHDDHDGIALAFAAAMPVGEELRVVRWAVAVARRAAGVLLADGRQAVRPDPGAAVDLTVRPARPVHAEELLEVVRAVVATARLEAVPGGPGHQVLARTPYDGDLVVAPGATTGRPWSLPTDRGQGGSDGAAVHLVWRPPDPYELQVFEPSGLHLIARDRARALLARAATLLRGRAGGVVVDDAGFEVSERDLELRRAAASPGARAWV
ncbi:hypothetical protein ACH436_17135 [Isoptericola sp. NPDC019693]|uniref:hypothetical protein n=1 Tax=Isoptericola sp. NPDC019693 TaxID=3364009 RepID=UPI0037925779